MAGDDHTESPQDPAGEARDRFEDAFERLQARSKRSAELNREGADFDTLTADHAELEMMRREAWRAKKDVVSRYEGATPDYVPTPVGMPDTTTFGRVAAIVGALILAAAIPLFWFGWNRSTPEIDIAVGDQRVIVQEASAGRNRCLLEVPVVLTNDSVDSWRLRSATAVIDRTRVSLSFDPIVVEPQSSSPVTFLAVAAPVGTATCPELNDLSRGSLAIDFVRIGASYAEIRQTARLGG